MLRDALAACGLEIVESSSTTEAIGRMKAAEFAGLVALIVLYTLVFDVLDQRFAADVSLGFAILAMLAAAVAGYADFSDTDDKARVVATVHSVLMVGALLLFVISIWLRLGAPEADRTIAIALLVIGYAVVAFSAWVGGEVVYALGNMVDRNAFRPRGGQWTALDVTDVPEGELVRAKAGAQTLVLVRQGERALALHDVCAHAACSLSKGRLLDGQVECSCHGSRYRLADGHVTRGPSVYDQPSYVVRRTESGWEARRA